MNEPALRIVERNLRTDGEELDIVVANHVDEPFWTALRSPLVLIIASTDGLALWLAHAGLHRLVR